MPDIQRLSAGPSRWPGPRCLQGRLSPQGERSRQPGPPEQLHNSQSPSRKPPRGYRYCAVLYLPCSFGSKARNSRFLCSNAPDNHQARTAVLTGGAFVERLGIFALTSPHIDCLGQDGCASAGVPFPSGLRIQDTWNGHPSSGFWRVAQRQEPKACNISDGLGGLWLVGIRDADPTRQGDNKLLACASSPSRARLVGKTVVRLNSPDAQASHHLRQKPAGGAGAGRVQPRCCNQAWGTAAAARLRAPIDGQWANCMTTAGTNTKLELRKHREPRQDGIEPR